MKNSLLILVLSVPLSIWSQVSATVVNVIDGDSFTLRTEDASHKVRLYGIDCPEINQPYGENGKAFLEQYTSKTVTITKKDVDRYGRTVADVFYNDTLLNLILIQKGLAWHYKKYSSDQIFNDAEDAARKNSVGLWAMWGTDFLNPTAQGVSSAL